MKKIAFITDIHLDEDDPKEAGVDSYLNWERLLQDVSTRNVDMIVFGGDIGAASAYPWLFQSLQKYNYKFILGNHDRFANDAGFYKDADLAADDELYYSSEDATFKYIFMDTSTERVSAAQFNWLNSQLATDKTVVLFIHHPVLPVNTPVDRAYPLHGREAMLDALHNCGNKVYVFCGHYHMDDVQTNGNVTQYITPASSYQINKDAAQIEVSGTTFGYRLLTFANDRVEAELLMFKNEL
ncbi:metallophosphoesterase [Inquilinus sp. KBS0705]|nr:metallophosphoesterase [Inquilinus sp. KBS0705]